VGLDETDISDQRVASVFRVERMSDLCTTLAVSSNTKDGTVHSHRNENLYLTKEVLLRDLSYVMKSQQI
jgi:hypothetical protein